MRLERAPSRRGLLVGSVAATVGLAGCVGGPRPFTRVDLTVSDSFPSDPPATVPVSIDVHVQNVDSAAVALRDVELVAYDADRTELAAAPLGEFDRAAADEANRGREEHESFLTSTTVYSADWRVETTLDVGAVPEWLTVRVGEVWFGGEAAENESASAAVVSASTPPPAFSASVGRYAGARPPPETVGPDDFVSERVESGRAVEEPVLPPASARATNESASGE